MNKGMFIVVEGGDGSGKTTLIKVMEKYFTEKGYDVLTTREPGGVASAEKIREVILGEEVDSITEALLFASARREHLVKKVVPALKEGKIILCDRFVYSSLAYQGYARELGIENVYSINKPVINNLMPEVTIFLDVPPEKGLERIAKNRSNEVNRLDLEGLEFHTKVREGYLKAIEMYPENQVIAVDRNRHIDVVFEDVKNELEKLYSI